MKVLAVLVLAVFTGEYVRRKRQFLEYVEFHGFLKFLIKPNIVLLFTGCNANLFYADAPKPQLEVLTDAFWDYVSKATQTADDTLEMIKKTQFGQEVR